eukprot:comp17287_c0_seq1/m.16404 comp17287_c0_seq1/g.16404  ORF comp17287_c0_seq1/g.16404 comp17287_c0_seq1/m.16404 type:complete len:997 (-) comp17287_c0_seq1:391-3381(-)
MPPKNSKKESATPFPDDISDTEEFNLEEWTNERPSRSAAAKASAKKSWKADIETESEEEEEMEGMEAKKRKKKVRYSSDEVDNDSDDEFRVDSEISASEGEDDEESMSEFSDSEAEMMAGITPREKGKGAGAKRGGSGGRWVRGGRGTGQKGRGRGRMQAMGEGGFEDEDDDEISGLVDSLIRPKDSVGATSMQKKPVVLADDDLGQVTLDAEFWPVLNFSSEEESTSEEEVIQPQSTQQPRRADRAVPVVLSSTPGAAGQAQGHSQILQRSQQQDRRHNVHGVDFDEMMFDMGTVRRRRKKKKGARVKMSDLTPAEEEMARKAQDAYMKQEYQQAVGICHSIIKSRPRNPDPYVMLANIFNDLGEDEKALQYSLVAAHLQSAPSQKWIDLGLQSRGMGDLRQAVYCFNKAVRAAPGDIDLLWDRAYVYFEMGEWKRAAEGLKALLKVRPGQLQATRLLVRVLHQQLGQSDQALAYMEEAAKCNELEMDELNILTEMYIANQRWQEAYEKVRDWAEDHGIGTDTLPADLRVRLGIALVNLGQAHDAESHFEVLNRVRAEDYGDLYLEMIDNYVTVGMHDRALPLLAKLVELPVFQTAEMWARKGQCERALGQLEAAVESFAQVKLVKEAAGTKEGEASRQDGSGPAPRQEAEDTQLQASVSYTRAMLLLQLEKYEEFLDVGLSLVAWFLQAFHQPRKRRRIELFLASRKKKRKSETAGSEDNIDAAEMTLAEWVDLVLETCKVLILQKRPHEAKDILEVVASDRKRFQYKAEVVTTIRLMLFVANHELGDHKSSCHTVRMMAYRRPYDVPLFNTLNRLMCTAHMYPACTMPIRRLLVKYPDSVPLMLLYAHYFLLTGSYRVALAEYLRAYKQLPDEPCVNLFVGVALLNHAMSRTCDDRHMYALEGYAFVFRYHKLRDGDAEASYNLGRAFHQLGLVHLAVPYYEKVLSEGTPHGNEEEEGVEGLQREAAYNLSLIYRASGNSSLARRLLWQYCTV